MAITTDWFGFGKLHLAKKRIDWETDTIMIMLTTDDYTPNQDTHDYIADITNEVVATGYTAGGAEITNTLVEYNTTTNTLEYKGDNISLTITGNLTFRYGVVYSATGTNSPLIGYVDFGEDQSITDGTLTLTLPEDGIFADELE